MVTEYVQKGRVRQVGKVLVEITITNAQDLALVERGHLAAQAVRRVTLPDVIVDTGATTLCLPQRIINALGLPLEREAVVRTAAGVRKTGIHDYARLAVLGRSAIFDCVALPDEVEPLLGVIPFERLGLDPDLQNQTLRVLPDQGPETYWLAY